VLDESLCGRRPASPLQRQPKKRKGGTSWNSVGQAGRVDDYDIGNRGNYLNTRNSGIKVQLRERGEDGKVKGGLNRFGLGMQDDISPKGAFLRSSIFNWSEGPGSPENGPSGTKKKSQSRLGILFNPMGGGENPKETTC